MPSALAARAFEQLVTYIDEDDKATGQLLGFLSMVDRRKRTHRAIAEQLSRDDRRILRSAIPAAVAIEASPARPDHRRHRPDIRAFRRQRHRFSRSRWGQPRAG